MDELMQFLQMIKTDEGYQWFYDGIKVMEIENLRFHFYQDSFKKRVMKLWRHHSICVKELYDTNKDQYFLFTERSFQRFLKVTDLWKEIEASKE